jgi:hypothetical protein
MNTTNNDAPDKAKTVQLLQGSVATFVRPRDKKRIYVFPRKGESVENAINRVTARNGAVKEAVSK